MIFGDSTSKGITSLFPSPLLMLLLGADYLKRKKKKKKKENKGITSGLEPVEMISGEPIELKKGGFPDLSGDGKVTQKDILMGRGVIEKADGGIAVYANGGEAGTKYFGEDGLLFDPTNPLDYIMAVPGVGLAGAGIKALMVGNRLRKAKKALEPVAKLSNPTTNVAGLTALGVDLGTDPEIQDMFKSQSYSEMYEPGVAYEYEGGYFEYDPNDDEIYLLDEIPKGYRIEK